MASWALKRRFVYVGIFVVVLSVMIFLLWYFIFYTPPTCFDNKQNQKEDDVDCGGPCEVVCGFQTIDPFVLWTRVLKVSDDSYNVLAYVENPNFGVIAYNVPFTFRVFDANNILVYEKSGTTFIPSKTPFPVFEIPSNIGRRVPVKAIFEFTQKPNWVKGGGEESSIVVKSKTLSREDTQPRLDVVVENQSVKNLKNIEVTSIIFNADGNAIATSKTFIDSFAKGFSQNLVFTWPQPFTSKATRIDVVPIVRPQ